MASNRISWKFVSSAIAALILFGAAAHAVEVPKGTQLHVRLKSKVATNTSKPKDVVEATVIVPVAAADGFAIPAGATVRGNVLTVSPSPSPDQRAILAFDFTELETGGSKHKMAARVAEVDNARESVDEKGQLLGILSSETISARLDQGIGKLADRFSGFAGVLATAKGALLKTAETDIIYEPGVEMDIELTAPLTLPKALGPGPAAEALQSFDDPGLIDLARKAPFQTVAENPPKPSDITNLMIIGTREQVEAAFKAAGWSSAAALSAQSKFETFKAIAESRGYKDAPVSILLLEGKPPDLVFQKQLNTFAMRHHLRVWKRPELYQNAPVWVIAATHDTGIELSPENRTFIHKIDSKIDRERSKVVNDLIFTGMVKGLALVDRPQVPTSSRNATGDALETDAAIAVLLLK
jgi:hypothetical protein